LAAQTVSPDERLVSVIGETRGEPIRLELRDGGLVRGRNGGLVGGQIILTGDGRRIMVAPRNVSAVWRAHSNPKKGALVGGVLGLALTSSGSESVIHFQVLATAIGASFGALLGAGRRWQEVYRINNEGVRAAKPRQPAS
jgi:hypothetical protein